MKYTKDTPTLAQSSLKATTQARLVPLHFFALHLKCPRFPLPVTGLFCHKAQIPGQQGLQLFFLPLRRRVAG